MEIGWVVRVFLRVLFQYLYHNVLVVLLKFIELYIITILSIISLLTALCWNVWRRWYFSYGVFNIILQCTVAVRGFHWDHYHVSFTIILMLICFVSVLRSNLKLHIALFLLWWIENVLKFSDLAGQTFCCGKPLSCRLSIMESAPLPPAWPSARLPLSPSVFAPLPELSSWSFML